MTEPIESAALEAYARFFTRFNSRDAAKFTAALNFPHVRVSPRRAPVVIEEPTTHAERQTWEPFIATGWDHTIGKPGECLHVGEAKAHVLGGWTRYTADEKPILSNTVAYIVTQVEGQWGIQSRFGIDPGDEGDTTMNYDPAMDTVTAYIEAFNARDWSRCAEAMNYPTLLIDPGRVGQWESANDFSKSLGEAQLRRVSEFEAKAMQGGPNAVNVALDAMLDDGAQRVQALFSVTLRGAHWGIQARSII